MKTDTAAQVKSWYIHLWALDRDSTFLCFHESFPHIKINSTVATFARFLLNGRNTKAISCFTATKKNKTDTCDRKCVSGIIWRLFL